MCNVCDHKVPLRNGQRLRQDSRSSRTVRGGSGQPSRTTLRSVVRANAVLRMDPTRTTLLRRAFVADVTRRFRRLTSAITEVVDKRDVFGLRDAVPNRLVFSAALPEARAYAFQTTSRKVESFLAWMDEMVEDEILQVTTRTGGRPGIDSHWSDVYVRQAYQRGVDRAQTELGKVGYEIPDAGIEGLFNQPVHADRLGVLFTRTFHDLKGITGGMSNQIARVLTQGMAEGKNPLEIARILNRTIKGGKGLPPIQVRGGATMSPLQRAKTLARTEIIRAHHVATIAEYERAGIDGVKVQAEWGTAGDDRVCEQCASLEGTIYTLDEIRALIPAHPNCRCVALPVLPDEGEAAPDVPIADPVAASITDRGLRGHYLAEKADHVTWLASLDPTMVANARTFMAEIRKQAARLPGKVDYALKDAMKRDYLRFRAELKTRLGKMDLPEFNAASYDQPWSVSSMEKGLFDWQQDSVKKGPMTIRAIATEVEQGITPFKKLEGLVQSIDAEYGYTADELFMVADTIDAQQSYVSLRALNQAYMDYIGMPKTVTLYRGTEGLVGQRYAQLIKQALDNPGSPSRNKFFVENMPLSGYSKYEKQADRFGYRHKGITVRIKVPREDIVVHEDLLSGANSEYWGEGESIVLGKKRQIPLKDIKTWEKPEFGEL